MTKLESNLYSLAFLATNLKLMAYTIKAANENKEFLSKIKFEEQFIEQRVGFKNSIVGITSAYILIQFCSFLDEYEKFNPANIGFDYMERIKKVRTKNKYGIKRIKKWNNLFEYRNQILAHNFDIQKESILLKSEKVKYNIPNNFEEIFVVFKICEKICRNIFDEFNEIRDNFDFSLTLSEKMNIPVKDNFDFERELELIETKM